MRYTLMHKDVEVANLMLNDTTGHVDKVEKILNTDHMPMGTTVKGKFLDTGRFIAWWRGRTIPISRSGVRNLFESLEISDALGIITKSMGLSLSDHYWIRPDGSTILWADVNFFDNDFSEDVGNLLMGKPVIVGQIDLSSPDITSEGNLKKKWKIMDGIRYLVKGGTGPFRQETFNEVVASVICDVLNIDHVEYSIVWDGTHPYCVCPDFIDDRSEYITAHHILNSFGSKGCESVYGKYVRSCSQLGVDAVPFLDRMIALDYVMLNEDRHLNNFGLIRNPDTLDWIGPAPIYDTGSSLGYEELTDSLGWYSGNVCKPFSDSFEKQLSYVTSWDWFDPDAIDQAIPRIQKVFEGSNNHVDAERSEIIAGLIEKRTDRIRRLL